MYFDKITEDGHLWSVRYEGDVENALALSFSQWNDIQWLWEFFKKNKEDLESYFKITDINKAIYHTLEDTERLQCLILDLSPGTDLEKLFRPLNNTQTSALILNKEKARLNREGGQASWLRLYAIRLEKGVYVITGGAIKLTATMEERQHTLQEINKMEKVRNFLIEEDIVDQDSFLDYQESL